MTISQQIRQETRNNGKYAAMLLCNRCSKPRPLFAYAANVPAEAIGMEFEYVCEKCETRLRKLNAKAGIKI